MNDFAAIKGLLTNFAAGINKLFNPSFEDQRQQYTIEGSRAANSLDTSQLTKTQNQPATRTSNPWPGTQTFEDFRAASDPLKDIRDLVNSRKQSAQPAQPTQPVEEVTETVTEVEPETAEDDEDVVTYTYKKGDTFGQVILDLGLMTDKGLWGPGGDVEYYTQQLIDQDMLDERGNVKLGKEFKLRRRK